MPCHQSAVLSLTPQYTMNMFQDFYKGELDIYRLNFEMLTLIPKEADATAMRKFRPISLLNCSFKIFAEVLTNRISLICRD